MVRRIQTRLVKALEQGHLGQAKRLQRLLVNSTAAKFLAVRQVVSNRGKNTPGIDGVVWKTPQAKYDAAMKLTAKGYSALPLRRVYIPKANGSRRKLGIPTMHDRAMQALYALALVPIAETLADPNSYGFRKERSVADAIAQCFCVLAKKNQAVWVLEGDIHACFDEISHEWVVEHVPLPHHVLEKWLKSGVLDGGTLEETTEGTPQGGIISPVISNLVLDGLETELNDVFAQTRRDRYTNKVYLIRYADDFIITGVSKELLEEEVKPLVKDFLAERGLTLSESKTRIVHINEGFDFLGFHLCKYDGKLLITPSKKSVKHILTTIRTRIKQAWSWSAERLIDELNRIIRGWANVYRHVVSKETFSYIDSETWKCLWKWARRRHGKKTAAWRRKRYFTTDKGCWGFCDLKAGKTLLDMVSVPIRRHIKIRREANPYDPQWEAYFEQRQQRQTSWGKMTRTRYALWRRQDGKCPWCGGVLRLDIEPSETFHVHHVVWTCHGGNEALKNKQLLHDVCHRQIHALNDSTGAGTGQVVDLAFDGLSRMR
jgi:RNA-directed DNA polymerase